MMPVSPKIDEKRPKKGSREPPGRGVLRFSARGYRNPVHILTKIDVFSENRPI